MSAELQWAVVRKNSCFLIKSQGKTLTKTEESWVRNMFEPSEVVSIKEPNNITGLNNYKYNGLVNKKTIGLEQAPSGKGIVLSVRKVKGANKPNKMHSKVTLSKDSRHSLKTIKSLCGKNYYRQDLLDSTLRRASLILRSQKPTAGVQKKRSHRKRN